VKFSQGGKKIKKTAFLKKLTLFSPEHVVSSRIFLAKVKKLPVRNFFHLRCISLKNLSQVMVTWKPHKGA